MSLCVAVFHAEGWSSPAWHPCGARAALGWLWRRPRSPTQGSAWTPHLPLRGATGAAMGCGSGVGPGNTARESGGPASSQSKPRTRGRFPVVPARLEPKAARALGFPAQERLGTSDKNRLAGCVVCRCAQRRSSRRAWPPASPSRGAERASSSHGPKPRRQAPSPGVRSRGVSRERCPGRSRATPPVALLVSCPAPGLSPGVAPRGRASIPHHKPTLAATARHPARSQGSPGPAGVAVPTAALRSPRRHKD